MNEATATSPLTLNTSLQQRGEALSEVSTKIGCGTYRFEKTGRTQLEALLRNGLNPWDKFLDIGCGAFCVGYWVMHFLNKVTTMALSPI